jgi:predicted neutral ceramidase superfamily lipid hydrolase
MIKVKDVTVFGSQKATEIVATVNSMVSMLSITAPLIMGGAIALSLLSVLLIPW